MFSKSSGTVKKLSLHRGSDIAVLIMPARDIKKFTHMPELQQHCLYLLIDSTKTKRQIYVGQTRGFAKRSTSHRRNSKLTWDRTEAIVLAKNSDSSKVEFEATHIQYFEYLACKKLDDEENILVNDQPVNQNYVSPVNKRDIEEDFRCFVELLDVVNIHLFTDQPTDTRAVGQSPTSTTRKTELKRPASKYTFLGAAHIILAKQERPMHYKEITRLALQKDLIATSGKTPDQTMLANIGTDIRNNKQSKFVRMGKGVIKLKVLSK